jgi:hypothetical protein
LPEQTVAAADIRRAWSHRHEQARNALYLARIYRRIGPAHDRMDRPGMAQGSAPIQHGVGKRRETAGINRTIQTQERATQLGVGRPIPQQEEPENPQVSARISALEQLPRHHHKPVNSDM